MLFRVKQVISSAREQIMPRSLVCGHGTRLMVGKLGWKNI